MNNATKGLILSGLVYPGLGQFMLEKKVLGTVLMVLATTGLAVYAYSLVVRLMIAFDQLRLMAANASALPEDMLRFYARIFVPDTPIDTCAVILLVSTWLLSCLHAFRVGQKLDRS